MISWDTLAEKMNLERKELIVQNLLWRGKIKKVLSRAHVCSLVQRAKNAYNQNEQTLHPYFIVSHGMV